MLNDNAFMRFRQRIGDDKFTRLRHRLEEVNRDIKNRGIRSYNENKGSGSYNGKTNLLTGYSYDEFYDWDLYFENIYMSYYGVSKYCRNNLESFLDKQLASGFVSRTIIEPRHRQHFKPFLAQIALLGSRQTGTFEWLRYHYYDRLKKYLSYWFWFCDFDKNGLCVWNSADHSGMDNQDLRAGVMDSMCIEGVDLNTYLVRELIAMAEIADKLGHHQDAKQYTEHSDKLKLIINDVFWDEEDGFYYDRNERTKELVKVKSIAGFLPLWEGIIPEERAERIIKEHLLNEDEFWLPYPIATWAKTEKGFYSERIIKAGNCNWLGTTWIPTNYMIFHGLMKYGYMSVAKELAYRTFNMVLQEADTREYYSSITGVGQGLNPFWGWSTLAYFMPLEYELDYDPSDIKVNRIRNIARDYLDIEFNQQINK